MERGDCLTRVVAVAVAVAVVGRVIPIPVVTRLSPVPDKALAVTRLTEVSGVCSCLIPTGIRLDVRISCKGRVWSTVPPIRVVVTATEPPGCKTEGPVAMETLGVTEELTMSGALDTA